MDILENSATVIVGPSGAGKTSLIRLIARHWDVTSGSILLDGRNIQDYPLEMVLRNIALISQDVFLFNDTILNNIRMDRRGASLGDVKEAARAANAAGFIEALPAGYDSLVGENGAKLSGGERQRLSLARALLREAPVLVMDEVTAHLDALHEGLVQESVNTLAGDKTMIIVSHRLDSVKDCDAIALMSEGRLEAFGSHYHLLAHNGLYKRLWAVQQDNLDWALEAPRGVDKGQSPTVEAAQ